MRRERRQHQRRPSLLPLPLALLFVHLTLVPCTIAEPAPSPPPEPPMPTFPTYAGGTCTAAKNNVASMCCQNAPPSKPNPERPILLSYFLAVSNDEYGGYRSAMRASTSLAGVIYGTQSFNLTGDTEILVLDWNSPTNAMARCTPEFLRVLDRVPLICKGQGDYRTCERDLVRVIEVPEPLARRYADHDSVSEVHTFNMAVLRARGKIILRIDQDTLCRGPWFSWLLWQKKSNWPDINYVWWHGRDSGIGKHILGTVIDDMRHYIHREEHHCDLHHGPVPDRGPYNASYSAGHLADWGGSCVNGAVGVYGYPIDLMKDVRGMNERFIEWGGMEAELCERARLSPVFKNWIDVGTETCGPSFSHIEHNYGKRSGQGARFHNLTFANDENWGLQNETSIVEYVY